MKIQRHPSVDIDIDSVLKGRKRKEKETENNIELHEYLYNVKCQIKLTNYRAECANTMCNILRKYFLYKVFVFIWDKIPISGFRNNACIIACQYCLCCRNIRITGVPWRERERFASTNQYLHYL